MKKTILFITISIVLVIVFPPKGINTSKREALIRDLQSTDYFKSSEAVSEIINNKVYEVLPLIQTDFWQKNLTDKENYLDVMVGLNYRFSKSFILALYDSIETRSYETIDSIDAKLNLCLLLIKLNDYSKLNYVVYVIKNHIGKSGNSQLIELLHYLLDVPEYELMAKSTLLRLVEESEDEWDRILALYWLKDKYNERIIPELINLFPSLSNTYLKQIIIRNNLYKGDFKIVSEFLKEISTRDTSEIIKSTAAEYLFDSLNVPSNYISIKKYLRKTKRDRVFHRLVEMGLIGRPYQPQLSTIIEEVIDSTESYLIQCQQYKWIGKNDFVKNLKTFLKEARSKIAANNLTSSYNNIKLFQDQIEKTYKDSLNTNLQFVTIEGFMFLYWNAQYILDRLHSSPRKKE